jgi:hypothetical protein
LKSIAVLARSDLGRAENLRRWAQVCSEDKNFQAAMTKLTEAKKEIGLLI